MTSAPSPGNPAQDFAQGFERPPPHRNGSEIASVHAPGTPGRSPGPAASPGTVAERRDVVWQQAFDAAGGESTRDSGTGRRQRRRAPCTARTRARSTGRRARRHRHALPDGRETPHQRALADARRTAHVHGRRAPARRPPECVVKRPARGAADERRFRERPPARWPAAMARRRGAAGRPRHDRRDARRIATQQPHADRAEIGRHIRARRRGCRRVASFSCGGALRPAGPRRESPGQRFVQRHAHAVPVAGLGWRHAGAFLGRHVRGRSADHVLGVARLSGKSSAIKPKSRITTRPSASPARSTA